MSIYNILEIAFGVLTAKLIIGVIDEGYRHKWQRIRLEFKRLFCRSKRQEKKIEVSHTSKKSFKGDVPLVSNARRSKTTGKYGVTQKRCAFPRFFHPPN